MKLLTCNSKEHSPARDGSSKVCSTANILPSIRTIHWCRKVKGAITQNVAVRNIANCLPIHCPRYYGWWDTQNLTLHYGWQMFWYNHVCWVNTKMGLILRSCQKENTDLLNIIRQKSQNQRLINYYTLESDLINNASCIAVCSETELLRMEGMTTELQIKSKFQLALWTSSPQIVLALGKF